MTAATRAARAGVEPQSISGQRRYEEDAGYVGYGVGRRGAS